MINRLRLATVTDQTTGQHAETFTDAIPTTVRGWFPDPTPEIEALIGAEDWDALHVAVAEIPDDDLTADQWARIYAEPWRRDDPGDKRHLAMWGSVVTLAPAGPTRGLDVAIEHAGETRTVACSTWLQVTRAVQQIEQEHAERVALDAVRAAAEAHVAAVKVAEEAEAARDRAIRAAARTTVRRERIAEVAGVSVPRYYQIVAPRQRG